MLEILKHELETVMALAGWFKHIILVLQSNFAGLYQIVYILELC